VVVVVIGSKENERERKEVGFLEDTCVVVVSLFIYIYVSMFYVVCILF